MQWQRRAVACAPNLGVLIASIAIVCLAAIAPRRGVRVSGAECFGRGNVHYTSEEIEAMV